MPVCLSCNVVNTCSSCVNNLVISGSICDCTSPTVLNPNTTTCIACTDFDANCVTCSYTSGTINASSPTNIVCSVPQTGYYVQVDGTTAQCGSYCDACTSPTVCTSCQATFDNTAGTCSCSPSPLFLNNIVPPYC